MGLFGHDDDKKDDQAMPGASMGQQSTPGGDMSGPAMNDGAVGAQPPMSDPAPMPGTDPGASAMPAAPQGGDSGMDGGAMPPAGPDTGMASEGPAAEPAPGAAPAPDAGVAPQAPDAGQGTEGGEAPKNW